MKKTYITAIIIIAALGCLLVAGAIAGAGFVYLNLNRPAIVAPTPPPPPLEATSTPLPAPAIKQESVPISDPPGDTALPTHTEELLYKTDIPVRDLRLLASRLRYEGQSLPEVANDVAPTYKIGDQDAFWILDNTSEPPQQFERPARLQYITDHAYWWVEDGFKVKDRDLQRSGDVFENQTYPTNRSFFGSEWSPGVDNDVRVSIYLGDVPGVGGYYASSHEFTQEVDPYSNQREMFFINLNALQPGNNAFDGVLAHEFQHMIHWYQDRNEETWVNEGLSELAVFLNDFAIDRAQDQYLKNPDLQLTTWAENPEASIPHYGSSYLFMSYFLDQFGEAVMKAVVTEPANGIRGFNNALQTMGRSETFDDIFADFIIANYLNDQTAGAGKWGYKHLSIDPAIIDAYHGNFPANQTTTVRQYGVDYIELHNDSPLTIQFSGATMAPLLNNQAHSGSYQWYSNRGDDSNASLTRAIDLSGTGSATLNYWVWYNVEEDWDYAYLEVSTSGGQSWDIIQTPLSRTSNPTGNAYGPGYTGHSGGWVEETVDLTPYAGQEILLRFEYITDDATNLPGFAMDDLAIPEIGLFDDMETGHPAWQAEGFIRMDNRLRQRFIVQVIDLSGPPTITRIPLDEANTGSLAIGRPGQAVKAILVVSAQAPVTTEIAEYSYSITPAE